MVTLIAEPLRKKSLDINTSQWAGSLSILKSCSPESCWPTDGLMPESSYWQLCPPSKPSAQGVLSSSFPPGPVPLVPSSAHLPEGDSLHRPLVPSTSVTDLSFPVLIREAAAQFLPPPPVPPQPTAPPSAVPASPSSACSTPSSLRRAIPPQLPRCHSQPCDLLLLKPGLKRRRDPDRPCARPVLDFAKMTQTRSTDPLSAMERGRLACGGDVCMGLEPFLGDFRGSCSPAEGLGRTSIGPLSESDEEEEEEEGEEGDPERDGGQQSVFERDCTELDLTLIEEN
ncbi:protein FAM53C isoform X2 [Denticeps clupeoides]|uniref:protein FAM53C isoform X2 n=1 Tax=Denticeps clupeoides TaxID=299321 RepID=UPI0010A5A0CC|nr:protein FAM53C-like isoform X2 [Denticeps clupeoides]